MNINAPEFIPSDGHGPINDYGYEFMPMPIFPQPVPLVPMVAPTAALFPVPPVEVNQNHQFMAYLEDIEYQQRMLKHQIEIMEGDENSLAPPQPIYSKAKPFTFVNMALEDRLDDLNRGHGELFARINMLQQQKPKVIGSTSIILEND